MYKLILGGILALLLTACEKEKRDCPSSVEKTYGHSGFNRIRAGDNFSLQIDQGAAYAITVSGCSNDLRDLLVTANNGELSLRYNRHSNERYKVDIAITLPALSNLVLEGAATATLRGFDQQTIHLKTAMSGAAKCTITGLPPLVKADLSGAGALTLSGSASDLIAHLSGDARLYAYPALIADTDVYTSGTAQAQLTVQRSLAALASGDSRIYYKGSPTMVSIETSGTARVIRE